MENVQVTLTICAGFDGGIIVYESDTHASRLVFGGDHEAATKYLAGRMARLIDDNAKAPGDDRDYPVPEYLVKDRPAVVAKLPQNRTVARVLDKLAQADAE